MRLLRSTVTLLRATPSCLRRVSTPASPMPSPAPSSPSPPEAEALISWLRKGGGSVSGAVVRQTEDRGWELAAGRDLEAGEEVAVVPKEMQLRVPCLEEDFGDVAARVPEAMWPLRLALPLLFECSKDGSSSAFAPYLDVLPKAHTLPVFFSRDEVNALQYRHTISQVALRSRELFKFASDPLLQQSASAAFAVGPPSAPELGWASACASSRAFRVGGGAAAMLPVIDTCNHNMIDPSCEVVGGSEGSVALKTLRGVREGEALDVCYGRLSNDLLLLDYGFVVEGNEWDGVGVPFTAEMLSAAREVVGLGGVPLGDASADPLDLKVDDGQIPLSAWQKAALSHLGLTGSEGGVGGVVEVGGAGWGRLMGGVRVLCAKTPGDVGLKDRGGGEFGFEECASLRGGLDTGLDQVGSLSCEGDALKTVLGVTVCALGQFATGIKEDEEMLLQELQGNMRLCVQYRLEKKKSVRNAAEKCKERLIKVSEALAKQGGKA